MGSHGLVPCTRLLYLALRLLSNLGGIWRGKGRKQSVYLLFLRRVIFRHSLPPSPTYILSPLPTSPFTALTFCFLEISLERTFEESKI